MKITLLGAGHIGQTIARLLHATGDYQVTVLDKNAGYLKVLATEGIATAEVDSDNRAALAAQLRGKDAVVNARDDETVFLDYLADRTDGVSFHFLLSPRGRPLSHVSQTLSTYAMSL